MVPPFRRPSSLLAGSLPLFVALTVALSVAVCAPALAQDCRLCESAGLDAGPAPVARPLRVEVDGAMEFGRLALTGPGRAGARPRSAPATMARAPTDG